MAEENEVANIYDPDKVRNFDVVGVVDRLDKALYEVVTSESASTNVMTSYDIERLTSYVLAIDGYIDTVNEQDQLDLPHSYPAMYQIQYITQDQNWDAVKNRMVRDFARLLANAMVHWTRSESADQSNRFLPADVNRWKLIKDRIIAYIEKYVEVFTPLDQPESSKAEQDINQV